MRALRQVAASAVLSLSLVANSTAAVASAAPPPASADPWLALSMLTPGGAAVLGDAAVGVSAAQPEAPPPPPQYTGRSTPPLPVILIWLAVPGTDVYLLTKNNHTHPVPNSPA